LTNKIDDNILYLSSRRVSNGLGYTFYTL